MPLTKREVDAARFDPHGPSQQVLYDGGELPGFGVRLYPSGKKSFVVRYRTTTGRPQWYTLGPCGAMTLT